MHTWHRTEIYKVTAEGELVTDHLLSGVARPRECCNLDQMEIRVLQGPSRQGPNYNAFGEQCE